MARGLVGRAIKVVALALGLALGVASANAHPGHKHSSRLIEVQLSGEPAVLKYGYVFEQSASEVARKVADRDGDGQVSVVEGQAELARLGDEVRDQLVICRGPTLGRLNCGKFTQKDVISADATGWDERPGKPLAVVWGFRNQLNAEDEAFELRDSATRAEIDRTDAAIELPKDARATAALSSGMRRPSEKELVFSWNEDQPSQVRRFSIAWDAPPRRWVVLSVVGGASALALLQLFTMWKRRRALHPSERQLRP